MVSPPMPAIWPPRRASAWRSRSSGSPAGTARRLSPPRRAARSSSCSSRCPARSRPNLISSSRVSASASAAEACVSSRATRPSRCLRATITSLDHDPRPLVLPRPADLDDLSRIGRDHRGDLSGASPRGWRIRLGGDRLRAAGHIPIDRTVKARAFEAYDDAARIIKRGFSPVVFPEGTRSRTGELLPFKNAPFALAIAAQVPIVPVYVHGTYRILPKGSLRLRPQPIRLQVGEPLPTAGLSLGDREALRDRVRAAIVQLKARVDAAGPHP